MRGRRIAAFVSATAIALVGVEAGLYKFSPQTLGSSWLTTSVRGYALNRRSTTVTHDMPGRSARYRINSLGFRGGELAGQGRSVLIVGDSVTFGLWLDETDTFVSRIASSAAREWGAGGLSFMNAAVAGWGTADYVAFVEDEGDRLRPDVVLVFIGFDDVRRAWVSPLWSLAENGTVSRRPPSELRTGVRRIANVPGYRFLIEHSHAAQLVRRALIASESDSEPVVDRSEVPNSLTLTEGLFARLSEWCRSRRIALLVSNGTLLEFSGETESQNPTATFLKNAEALFARLSVPYLSVARAHGALTEPLTSFEITDDGHPNERGARLIFETVWPWLGPHLQRIVERPSS